MPKFIRILLLSSMVALTTMAAAQSDAQKAFNAIKNMPGTWEQKAADGHVLQVTFRVVSAGSAVMSEIHVPNEGMISMFHLDGPKRLLLTHYCAAGNQPRMLGTVSHDGKTIRFNYLDATNLKSSDDGHMQKMVLTIIDDNHHTEEWFFVDHGKEMREVFDLRRKAS